MAATTSSKRKSTSAGKTRATRAKTSTSKAKTSTRKSAVKAAPAVVLAAEEPPVEAKETAPENTVESTAAVADIAAQDSPLPLKMPDLIRILEDGSALRRSDLRATATQVLEALGQALLQGKDLNLPGIGRVMVKRRVDGKNGTVLHAKLKPKAPAIPDAE